jgi:DNA polymerase-3 subunit gamma/tau
MEYQVIARKWRPQTFDDVLGQEHLTKALKNAIIQNRVAHAYLFVGPRGIGKTSSARIFAKALNCLSPRNGEPCCECEPCKSITEGSCMDVIEIDAASNNSVNNIRELCEEATYSPASCKYKIFIIDEIHMLSSGAWNALLKMVEEPPEHVKFIFATTEAHKVLPTILSRCQRYDLRRIPTATIVERLRFIVDAEGISITDGALLAIARTADGGMRDAQSLLDQMIAFFSGAAGDVITEEQILDVFGLTNTNEMATLLSSLLTNDKAGLILNVFSFTQKGKNIEKLLEEILLSLRTIQIIQLLPNPNEILELQEDDLAIYKGLSSKITNSY